MIASDSDCGERACRNPVSRQHGALPADGDGAGSISSPLHIGACQSGTCHPQFNAGSVFGLNICEIPNFDLDVFGV